MRILLFTLAGLLMCPLSFGIGQETEKEATSALNFKMKSIGGEEVDLNKKYQGKVVMFVNVASKCGLTPQYEQLQALHDKYSEKGLAVVGFPCNQFAGQEPWNEKKIQEFCESKYNVKFDMMSKVNVNGKDQCGLYKYLTSQETKPAGKGRISWNFEKFLVNKKGEVVARFSPRTKPNDKALVSMIEEELKK